ncbi:Ms4533A family Cys-rich leader peptide [Prescottella subtropica]|uniref:Ms4533A family Cys-rich leader peptide n=1 Tax=Prescottella subtropica TaxID=2545757 RepID=UPI003BAA7B3C
MVARPCPVGGVHAGGARRAHRRRRPDGQDEGGGFLDAALPRDHCIDRVDRSGRRRLVLHPLSRSRPDRCPWRGSARVAHVSHVTAPQVRHELALIAVGGLTVADIHCCRQQ